MSAATMRETGLRFALGLAVALALALVPNRRTEDWSTLGRVGLVAFVVVLIVVVAAWLPVRFVVDQRGLTVRRLGGLTRTVGWAQLGRGVYVDQLAATARGGTQTTSRLFLRDQAGRRVLQLNSQTSGREELLALASALGQDRFDYVPGPVNGKELGRQYPGMVSVLERRPVLVAMLATVVIVAVVVVGVLLFADV